MHRAHGVLQISLIYKCHFVVEPKTHREQVCVSRTVTYTTVVQEFFTIDADDFYSDGSLGYSPE